ncbi:hypothetical protein [Orientia tsutsugamushi]|uniref:hypothetical protein n=1 Tax=Orientia tsutsugamushi TaxID=784 RepID=UPI0007E311AB|nr:hypothetical protein [Orientia tsutsugamushi]
MKYDSLDVDISYFYKEYLIKADNVLTFEINDNVYESLLHNIMVDLQQYQWNQGPLTIEFNFNYSNFGYVESYILCNGLSEVEWPSESTIKLSLQCRSLNFEGAMQIISFYYRLPNINLWIDLQSINSDRRMLISYVKQAIDKNTENAEEDIVTIHNDRITVLCSQEIDDLICEGDTNHEPNNHF